jgi:hypothetical protein
MNNLEYIEINLNINSSLILNNRVEEIARLYLELLGFKVFHSIRRYDYFENLLTDNKADELNAIISDRKGLPDLCCIKDNSYSFVEVKSIKEEGVADSLSLAQLKWIQHHPTVKIIILGVFLKDNRDDIIKEIEEKLSKIIAEKDKLISYQYKEIEKLKEYIGWYQKTFEQELNIMKMKREIQKVEEINRKETGYGSILEEFIMKNPNAFKNESV